MSSKNREREIYLKGLEFVPRKKIAIDCGASEGLWTEWLSEDFEYVIAIEPIYENFIKLNKKNWNNVRIINAALWDNMGEITLFNSIKKNPGHWTAKFPGDIANKCKCITIDSLNIIPDYIKMDIQGSEIETIKGCKRTLDNNVVLNIEVILNNKYIKEISNILNDIGYKTKTRIYKHEIFINQSYENQPN